MIPLLANPAAFVPSPNYLYPDDGLLRFIGHVRKLTRSKYQPHQGKREIARRAARMGGN